MAQDSNSARSLDDQEVAERIERYIEQHPKIREALEVFRVSQQSYEASMRALQNRPVHSSRSANDTALQRG